MAVDAARAKSLFLNASDQSDPAERAAYLDRECGDDAELRGRVEALLRANDASPLPPPGTEDATIESNAGRPPTEATSVPTPKTRSRSVTRLDHGRLSHHRQTKRPHRRSIHAPTKNRRRRHGRGLGRQANRAGQAKGRLEADQDRHGLPGGSDTLRAGTAGAGDDGPSQYRQGARRRPDADRSAVLRHGAGQRSAAARSSATS